MAKDSLLSTTPCHCHALRQITRTVTQAYDHALAPVGVTTPQFSLLRMIAHIEPTNITMAARRVRLDRTTLGRNLRPLAEAGFISLQDDGRDARERQIVLTEAGHAAIAQAAPLWKATQDRIASRMGREKLSQLRTLLADLESAVG